MITFRLALHTVRPNTQIVEVLIDGRVSATITPGAFANEELRIITRHLVGAPKVYTRAPNYADADVIQIFLKRKD